jgi:metal-responsive CopG/Arc/MetJ family transcriptional regulator
MRKKLKDDEKKQKIGISINSDLNNLVENEMKETGKKKSQILEKAISFYLKKEQNNENE